jgi:hypothetical protein
MFRQPIANAIVHLVGNNQISSQQRERKSRIFVDIFIILIFHTTIIIPTTSREGGGGGGVPRTWFCYVVGALRFHFDNSARNYINEGKIK